MQLKHCKYSFVQKSQKELFVLTKFNKLSGVKCEKMFTFEINDFKF